MAWNANTFATFCLEDILLSDMSNDEYFHIIQFFFLNLHRETINFFQVSFPSEAEQGYSGDEAQGCI